MFSGIVEKLARVRTASHSDATLQLTVETGYGDLELGESVAVNGVCLTVVRFDAEGTADFYVSRETTTRSNLGAVQVGHRVNLERSVRLETRLSGHLVQGHVDGLARLSVVTRDGEAHRIELDLPPGLGRFCVEKGSIALNGISLTLNTVADVQGQTRIGLTIIPHTWEHTNLCDLAVGAAVNVEVDVIAKYVERLCQPYIK